MSDAAVILAGGSGTRVGAAVNKVYLPLAGRSLISWSVNAFVAAGVSRLLVVAKADELGIARQLLQRDVAGPVEVIAGGSTRHQSEYAALTHLAAEIDADQLDLVAIHDGARPLVTAELIRSVFAAASNGGALPGISTADLVVVDAAAGYLPVGSSVRTVRVQTPQVFRAPLLLAAYRQAQCHGFIGSDTAATVEQFGNCDIACVAGSVLNLKVTFPQDVLVAERLLSAR